jgi:hypothetical protein
VGWWIRAGGLCACDATRCDAEGSCDAAAQAVGLTVAERSGVTRALSFVLALGNVRFADAAAGASGFDAAAHALGYARACA